MKLRPFSGGLTLALLLVAAHLAGATPSYESQDLDNGGGVPIALNDTDSLLMAQGGDVRLREPDGTVLIMTVRSGWEYVIAQGLTSECHAGGVPVQVPSGSQCTDYPALRISS